MTVGAVAIAVTLLIEAVGPNPFTGSDTRFAVVMLLGLLTLAAGAILLLPPDSEDTVPSAGASAARRPDHRDAPR